MQYKNFRLIILGFLSLILFNGCAITQNLIGQRELVTHTKMSSAVFLHPAPSIQRTVFLNIKNTSAHSELSITKPLRNLFRHDGYRIVDSPNQAYYIVDLNMLQAGQVTAEQSQLLLNSDYGDAIPKAEMPSDADDKTSAKEVIYTITTDLQISERVQTADKKIYWNRYQTRIISIAEKVDLKFNEAKSKLIDGIIHSILSVF